MITIVLNKKSYKLPTSWDELTEKQLLQVMQILFLKNYTGEQALLQLLRILSGMTNYEFLRCAFKGKKIFSRKNREEDMSGVMEMDDHFYLLAFLLQPDAPFTKNIIPSFDDGRLNDAEDRKIFYGPDDALANLRMKEFTNTEFFFKEWVQSERQNEEALTELVAILYRPSIPGYNHEKNDAGDHREPFNHDVVKYYAKHFVRLWPPSVKLAIATWYNGCRRKIIADNEIVFEGGSGEEDPFGLVSVMLDVAETHMFGDFNKVEDQYVFTVMMSLTKMIKKAREIERQAKASIS